MKKMVSMRIDDEVWKKIAELLKGTSFSRSQVVEMCLRTLIEESKKKNIKKVLTRYIQ